MNIKRSIAVWFLMALMMVNASGCAAIGAALSAGIGYAIYQATKK